MGAGRGGLYRKSHITQQRSQRRQVQALRDRQWGWVRVPHSGHLGCAATSPARVFVDVLVEATD